MFLTIKPYLRLKGDDYKVEKKKKKEKERYKKDFRRENETVKSAGAVKYADCISA